MAQLAYFLLKWASLIQAIEKAGNQEVKMNRLSKTVLSAAAGIMLASLAPSVSAEEATGTGILRPAGFSKEEIETIVHDYLLEHPEIILEVTQKLKADQGEYQARADRKLIESQYDAIFNDQRDGTSGAPADKAKTVIVEFFDYDCGYCKKTKLLILQYLKKHPSDVHYIYKEFPILSDESVYAARIAMAIQHLYPNKYVIYHNDLMTRADKIKNTKEVDDLVTKLGMDLAKVKAEADSDYVEKKIADNERLARNMGLSGTPAYIINGRVIRGAPTSMYQLEKLIRGSVQ